MKKIKKKCGRCGQDYLTHRQMSITCQKCIRFTRYMRKCKRCESIFYSAQKFAKVCPDCYVTPLESRTRNAYIPVRFAL